MHSKASKNYFLKPVSTIKYLDSSPIDSSSIAISSISCAVRTTKLVVAQAGRLVALCFALLFLVSFNLEHQSLQFFPSAHADTHDPIFSLPEDVTLLNLSARASRTIDQDELVATLRASHKDRSVTAVQNKVNELMQKALSNAKKSASIKVTTGSYQVYERVEARTKETLWTAQQNLTLRSLKSDQLLKLAQSLQSMGLQMVNLSYQVSSLRYAKVKDELLDEALRRLQTQANRTAKNLGKKGARIVEVSIQDDTGNLPSETAFTARSRSMMMADSVGSAPVAAAGESELSVMVSGRALLQ